MVERDTIPPPLARDSRVAERRIATILFADLVGFTPFAERLDPEENRDILSGYFDQCREVIQRYGGTIEKFIGDAVMAVWGMPTSHGDDAERPLRFRGGHRGLPVPRLGGATPVGGVEFVLQQEDGGHGQAPWAGV